MTFVVDLAWGWKTIPGSELVRIGASGFVAYIGCDDSTKNISKARFQEYLDCGLQGALVIENGPTDMLGGDKAGAEMGQNWLRGAESVGYDVAHCVGFTSGDFNAVNQAQYTALYDCQSAFGAYVPVHSYYGDQDSGDIIVTGSEALYLWQSDSTSFSHGVSLHARLLQRYNDPRAQGLAVDINDVLATPLYFMGENMTDPVADSELAALLQIAQMHASQAVPEPGQISFYTQFGRQLNPGTDPANPTVHDLLALLVTGQATANELLADIKVAIGSGGSTSSPAAPATYNLNLSVTGTATPEA